MTVSSTLNSVPATSESGDPRTDLTEKNFGFFDIKLAGSPSFSMLSLGDDNVVKEFIRNGVAGFEPFSLLIWAKLAENSGLAVDIGAYTGVYSLLTTSVNPNALVVAFEANPITFGRLITNILANQFNARIAPLNLGASSRSGHLDLTLHGGIYTMSSGESFEETRAQKWAAKRVDTIAADEILINWTRFHPSDLTIKLHDRPVDLIKIDVEGHEKHTLAGLQRVITRDRPTMLVEILKAEDLQDIVKTLPGYDALWVDESGALSRSWVPKSLNTLFVHESRRQSFERVLSTLGAGIPA